MSKRRLALFGSSYQELHLKPLELFVNLLIESGFEITIEEGFAGYLRRMGVSLPEEGVEEFSSFEGNSELAISIGGDGTFLRTARAVGKAATPILGVNTGHLGYLSHSTLDNPRMLVDIIARRDYKMEERMVLEVRGEGIPENVWPYALNEVAILKEETASMINASVSINGNLLADYLGDGVVISTPTGSTAYNLAVGGPLLQPTLSCIALSPIAPHTLTMRPMVVEGAARLAVRTTTRADHFRLSLDGDSFRIPTGGEISIRRAPFCIRVILRPDDNFAATLRSKLLWGRRE